MVVAEIELPNGELGFGLVMCKQVDQKLCIHFDERGSEWFYGYLIGLHFFAVEIWEERAADWNLRQGNGVVLDVVSGQVLFWFLHEER